MIELPDAELWQKNHEVQAALDAHRRDEAARIVAELQAEQPDHVVTLSARLHQTNLAIKSRYVLCS